MWRLIVVVAVHNIKNRFKAKFNKNLTRTLMIYVHDKERDSCSSMTMCLICFPAWSLAFEPEEVAVDEAVSMDASDVGWGETPAATTDTGWATFDSFTDIRMAPSRFVLCLSTRHLCTLDFWGHYFFS